MNFLEGLKRLFVLFATLVVVAAGGIAWSENGAPIGCVSETSIKWETPAASAEFSKMTDEELFASLRKADAERNVAQATQLAKVIEARTQPWLKDTVVVKSVRPLVICPPKMQALAKQAAYAAAFSAAAAAVLVVVWLCLRWVIVGFFPAAARKA